MTEEIINNQDLNTQKVLNALEDLRVYIQSQLTEKDKEIDYQKQARSIAENAVVECTKQITDLENKLANVSYLLEGREVELNELIDKCSSLLDKLYLSGLSPKQIALVEKMQDVLGV